MPDPTPAEATPRTRNRPLTQLTERNHVTTLAEVMTPHQVAIPAHLEAQAEVHPLSGLQRQGDVLIAPMGGGKVAGLVPVPREGVAVVRGEAGGNTHLLVADGAVSFAPAPATRGGLTLGSLAEQAAFDHYLTDPEETP